MEVSSCEGGSSPATAAATATATAARKEERSKLVQSPKAIPSKKEGRHASLTPRQASKRRREGGKEGRKEREGERKGRHVWPCMGMPSMPCHAVSGPCHVCSGEGGRHQRSACGCIRGPMTWRDLAPLWYGMVIVWWARWPWPCMVRLACYVRLHVTCVVYHGQM